MGMLWYMLGVMGSVGMWSMGMLWCGACWVSWGSVGTWSMGMLVVFNQLDTSLERKNIF